MKRALLFTALAGCATTGALAAPANPMPMPSQDIPARVEALLRQMTLEEKAGQLNQLSGKDFTGPETASKTNKLKDIREGHVGSMLNIRGVAQTREIQALALQSRLKIPLLFGLDVIHGYKTVFPVPLGEAASWDLEAIEQSARIAALEASASGVHWTFAPMVDIGRDPRWGRVMEGAGEDVFLGSSIARARVHGFQTDKLGGVDAIMATAKHFAAYGAAIAGRDYNAVDMSEQQLHETYLPPFHAAVDAGVATFMNAFNTLNGIPATASTMLQRDILKGSWKFPGFVVSDWGSVREMVVHGYVADLSGAAQAAMAGGSDMDMEGHAYRTHLPELARAGKVNMAQVDDAVRRVLTKKFELGLFDDPYRFSDAEREKRVMADPSHRAIARDVARKSMVLLKNERATLPLARTLQRIAVVGPFADARRDLEGGWIVQSDAANVVSLLDGIRSHAGSAKVDHIKVDGLQGALDAKAIQQAAAADVIVLAVGETWDMSGEAKSRSDISLPGRQEALFAALQATGKPVVAVIFAGRPLIFNHIADGAAAILYAWFPGSEGGNAVADVLFGDHNPAGRLPMTFPRNMGQVPISYVQYQTGRPVRDENSIVYKSAYIDSPNTPRYAFGYGLSYTSFAYSDLRLSKKRIGPTEQATLSFTLTNTGKRAGAEVAQLYLHDRVASLVRPLKELKGFQRVVLQPGESRTLSFTIDQAMLSFINARLQRVAEPGEFDVMVGASSDDIRLNTVLELGGAM